MSNQPYIPTNTDNNIQKSISPFFPHILANQDLDDTWNYKEFLGLLQRRALIIVGVATTLMTGVVMNSILHPQPPEYESRFQMLVEPVTYDTKVGDVVEQINPLAAARNTGLDYESQILVLRNPEVISRSIQQLQQVYPYIDYDYLMNSLSVNRVGETKVLEVRYRSKDPQESQAVLEAIAQDYLEYSQEKRESRLRQGVEYIRKELPSIQSRVNQVQRELQVFQQRNNFISPESLAEQITGQMAGISQRKQEIEIQLAQARSNYAFLQTEAGTQAVLDSYPVYQQLNAELRELDIQIAAGLATFQPNNPKMITLQEKRNNLLPLIQGESERYIRTKQAEASTSLQSLQLNQQELQRQQETLEGQFRQLPNLIREYSEIQTRLGIATASLTKFLSSREELQIEISQTELGWQLIQAPNLPQIPVQSSATIRNLIIGLFGSMSLGIGAALLMEKLDHTYHNAQSLQERLKIPLLGNVPFGDEFSPGKASSGVSPSSIISSSDSEYENVTEKTTTAKRGYRNYRTNFIEAVRVLYTNLQLLNSDHQIRSIVVTSAMQGDGKSTIAFYLAQIATTMGRRVLLVDADMRRPAVHNLANLNNLWGLSSLITSDLSCDEVTRQLPTMNALSIMTAGPIPPDATKLLSSEKMKKLMMELHEEFDLVIYDCPPIVGLADSNLIAPQTDGVLMVARIDKTDRSLLERAVGDLKMAPINLLGVVANGQKPNAGSYYYHDYYHVEK